MHPIPTRSTSPFPMRRSNGGGGGGRADAMSDHVGGTGGGERQERSLFRRINSNNAQQDRSSSSRAASLHAMRQFAVDATADAGAASAGSSPISAHASARPRTTGSVSQSLIGSRRQTIGSIRSMTHSNNRPPSGQQRPRLTRNLTLGDLRWIGPAAAVDAVAGGKLPHTGVAGRSESTNAVSGSRLMVRRGWQTEATRGGGSIVSGESNGGRSSPGRAEVPNGRGMSRLPLLDSPSPLAKREEQQLLRGSMHDSVEGFDLLEHGLVYGVSALKGHRPYMEDEFKVIPNLEQAVGSSDLPRREGQEIETTHFFGMFDGHAGGRCSKALTQILAQTVSREPDFSLELQSAVHKGFLRANAEFLRKAERFCANDGSTAITAFVRGRRLVVGNVGDSRAVLCSDGRALPMSSDHKPNKPEERRRVQALGGRVVYSFGIPRVNGILAVSRAFGDRNMKGAISAEPDVRERWLERHDEYLVLATDGLWDVMTSQEACNIVCNCTPDVGAQGCSELLTVTALRKGSLDNTSAMVVDMRGLWRVEEARSLKNSRVNGSNSSGVDGGGGGGGGGSGGGVGGDAANAEEISNVNINQELQVSSPYSSSSKPVSTIRRGDKDVPPSALLGVAATKAAAAPAAAAPLARSRPRSSSEAWALSQTHRSPVRGGIDTSPSPWNKLVHRVNFGESGVVGRAGGGGGGGDDGGGGDGRGGGGGGGGGYSESENDGRRENGLTGQHQQTQEHQQQQEEQQQHYPLEVSAHHGAKNSRQEQDRHQQKLQHYQDKQAQQRQQRQQQQQQQQQHLQRPRQVVDQADVACPASATTTTPARAPSREQQRGSGGAAGRVAGQTRRGADREEVRRGSSNPSTAPWPKMIAPKAWGTSVAAGSAWSLAGGGTSGGGGHSVSPHAMSSPNHVSSTELAMSLYGGTRGGGGSSSRSRFREGSSL